MAVAATRWRQDTVSAPQNPNQRLRWYPTYPGGNGYSTFGWSPMPLDNAKLYGSPAGIIDGSGLSGAFGAPLLPSWAGVAKVVGAIAGIAGGVWLAKRNLEG